jgi:hypothetical protein
MSSVNISLFANFRIDSVERLQRMKDSFSSMLDINFLNYVVNIRGALSHEARRFIEHSIPERLIISTEEDARGWMDQSLDLVEKLSADRIFIWVEDHIFVSSPKLFLETIEEAFYAGADCLYYSFLTPAITSQYSNLEIYGDGLHSRMYTISQDSIKKNLPWIKGQSIYTSSMVTVVTKNRFIHRLSNFKGELLRWPHETPFNFEQIWAFERLNKVIIAIPKKELFVSIDDDLDFNYSLISRGLYPNRINRDQLRIDEGLTKRFLISIKNNMKDKKLFFIAIIYSILKIFYFTIRYKICVHIVLRFKR